MITTFSSVINKITITVAFPALIATGCMSTKRAAEDSGWINRDTFILKAYGKANAQEYNTENRKKQSFSSAKSNAVRNAERIFMANISSDEVYFEDSAISSRKAVLDRIIKSGSVISESFDENQNCSLVYKISSKNLQSYVRNLHGSTKNSGIDDQGQASRPSEIFENITLPGAVSDPGKYLSENSGAFFGDDLYFMKFRGNPNKGENDVTLRKIQSRKAAELLAIYEIINTLYKPKHISDPTTEYSKKLQIYYEELRITVKSGKVIAEEYGDKQDCTIVYRVTKNGFRQWVECPF